MKVKIIVSAILSLIVEILLYNPMNIVWSTLFKSINRISEITTGEIPLNFLIAMKILEFGIFLCCILAFIELIDRIINSNRYRN